MSSTQQLLLGEGAGGSAPVYIEDVFSTYLYTGTGTGVTQRIAPGLDLSTKGGMVWVKNRTEVTDHEIYDTTRGERKYIRSNTTDAEFDSGANSVQYKTSGWDAFAYVNEASKVMASWTFREQPKFFDIVTYTGNGSVRTIAHNLGSAPGCIIVKDVTNAGSNWAVYHRSLNAFRFVNLNAATAETVSSGYWNNTEPTSTEFTVGTNGNVNQSSATFVAYLFAHDAGGFGLLGTDNVITCGQFDTDGAGSATVNLGYEPQWLLVKKRDFGGWWLVDTMRGMTVATSNNVRALFASSQAAEANAYLAKPNATGFTIGPSSDLGSSISAIYIAIRKGPMKVPTVGTTVFNPYTATLSAGTVVNAGVTPDLLIGKYRGPGTDPPRWVDRLRGIAYATAGTNPEIYSDRTSAESPASTAWSFSWTNTGYTIGNGLNGLNSVIYSLRRAPSFFDEVCYTGTGVAVNQLVKHNLTVQPQLIIVKVRSTTGNWNVDANVLNPSEQYAFLNLTNAFDFNGPFAGATATEFYATSSTNTSGQTFVAYLFATCAGVSKVGSYTGTGATQTINCGFTTGARFVMIKRTDSASSWWFWDTARGMVSGTDPFLLMNSDIGETNQNDIFTVSTGFQIVSAVADVNASGGKYLFLAIA